MNYCMLKPTKSDSFLVPSNRAGTRLNSRLQSRFERAGNPAALFITLTYKRDEWESPLHLYREQREKRHFRNFVSRVSKYLNESTNGKWIRKIEFQRGGWIHFHLILDTNKTIPHLDLMSLWGYGHCWINRCTKARMNYLCKYVSKNNDNVPAYILAEPQRSVKIVAVSPSYWNDGHSSSHHESTNSVKWAVYTPVAESLHPKVVIKTCDSTRTINASIWEVMSFLQDNGAFVLGTHHEYIHVALHDTLLHACTTSTSLKRGGLLPARLPLLDNGGKSADSHGSNSDERPISSAVFDSNKSFFINYFFEEEGIHA